MSNTPYYVKAETEAQLNALKRQIAIYGNSVQYNTYNDMILAGTPVVVLFVRILIDEDKGLNNTNYMLYPDGVRNWVASTSDN